MTKSSKKLLAIILSIVMVLACAVTLGLALTPKAEVKADATDYRGKVVIWDAFVANPVTDNGHDLWKTNGKNANPEHQTGSTNLKYFVIKNVTDENIDMSGWYLTQITKNGFGNKVSVPNGTIIYADSYIIITTGGNDNKHVLNSTLPEFVRNLATTPTTNISMIYQGTVAPGTSGGFMISTADPATYTAPTTTLLEGMVDMISFNNGNDSAKCYLGETIRVNTGTHLLRNDNYTKPEYIPNNAADYDEETNYWNSDSDNSLTYLSGATDNYMSIASAKEVTDTSVSVPIKATITHYDSANHRYTMQDSTGAMLVTVPEGTTVQPVGKVVLATGKVTSGAMTVESEDNFVPKNNGTVNYASPTLAQILAADSMYDNYCVELKNMSYDSTLHTISDGEDTLAVDENGVTVSGTKISLKGIVRVSGTDKTIVMSEVHEYKTYAYGEIALMRTEQIPNSGIDFSIQGYVTYANGNYAYLEDNNGGGIYLYGTTLGNLFTYKNYVLIGGHLTKNTDNTYIRIEGIQKLDEIEYDTAKDTYTFPTIHEVTNSSEIAYSSDPTQVSQYMHRSISIHEATILEVTDAKNNIYKIVFGTNNFAYVDYDGDTMEVGDVISINRGIIYTNKLNNQYTNLIKCGNSTEYLVVNTNSIQEIIENGADGDDVLTKGFVRYVDSENNLFILQYKDYGIVVINNSTKPITEISAGQSYKVAGTLTKNATETYITATTLTTRSGSAEAAVDATLADFATHNLQYVNVGTVKVSAVTDTHTYTVTDGTNTATLITAYEKGLHLYDYITVKAVVYNGNLVTSDESDVVNLMIDINTAYSSTAKDKDIYYVRGIVTYIEVDEHNSQEGIENLIIEQILGDGSRIALRAYFGNSTTLPAAGSVSLGDTVTLKGERKTFNGLVELDKTEVLGDIVAGEELDPVAMTIAKVNLQTAVKLYQSLYVKFSQVEIKEIIVDANEDIMVVLTQEGKLLNFYFGMLQDGETVSHAIQRVTEYFQGYDIFVGDKADIVGHLNYYKRKVDSVEFGGFRLELHLDGEHQVEDLDPTDYISNQVKTDYTLTYINGQNVVVRQETLKRNANFRTLDAINVPGKVFTAWDDSGVAYNANTNYAMPTHDLTLKATYTDKTYTVTFVTGTEEVINDIEGLEYNMRIVLPNPAITKANCTFGGWYMDENYSKAFTANTTITEDTTLYARWREKSSTDDSTAKGGADVTLVVIISVASTLVVVGGGILVVYFIKNRKKK